MSTIKAATIEGTSDNDFVVVVPTDGNLIVGGPLEFGSNASLSIPVGTTAQRPSGQALQTGMIRYNTDVGFIEVYTGANWVNFGASGGTGGYVDLGTQANPAPSALAIKREYPNAPDGVYWINPSGTGGDAFGPTQVYCDMTTDGGGWMMIAYAGQINTNKTNTVGGNYLPLFNTYGTLSSTAKTNRTAFSRMDFAQAIQGASDTSQLMARRTECQSKIFIWEVTELNRFNSTNNTNWTFPNNNIGTVIRKCKMSKKGPMGLVSRDYIAGEADRVRYENGPSYPGIAWNSSFNQNNDNQGSFETFLIRRSILYWETGESNYQANQWFHADPMHLEASRGYDNAVQDMEFYFREEEPGFS